MGNILIKNGRIWDGYKFFFADILTNGMFIEKIAPNIPDKADFIYDAENKTVSSGLIDIHAHLKNVSVDAFGIEAQACSFPFGVSAVNDAGAVKGDKNYLDLLGVKNTVFVPAVIKNNAVEINETDLLTKSFGESVVGIKLCFDKKIYPESNINLLKSVCDYAKNRNLKVMVHTTDSPVPMAETVNVMKCGDIITHAYHGGENNCTENDFDALKLAKEKGIIVDTGFAGYVHTDFSVFKEAIKAGYYPDTISSDITKLSAFKRGGKYGLTMCMSMARTAGLSEEAVFKCVTSSAAKVLNKEGEWGVLKEGNIADIAVLSFSHEGFSLTDFSGNVFENELGYRCDLTIIDGEVVYRN